MEYYTSWPHKHTGTQVIFTQNRENKMKKIHIWIVYSTYVMYTEMPQNRLNEWKKMMKRLLSSNI